MLEHKNIYQLVLAGVLCAIGLVVPMVMPKVIIGPMSFTLVRVPFCIRLWIAVFPCFCGNLSERQYLLLN